MNTKRAAIRRLGSRQATSLAVAAPFLAAAAGTAAAQPRIWDTGTGLIGEGIGGMRGPGNFATGFEASEGYAAGPIGTQLGWTASGLAFASVTTANPFAGQQHLRVGFDSTASPGAARVVLSPASGALPVGPSTTSVMVNISADQGADYDLTGQSLSQARVTWRVKFHFDGGAAGTPGEVFILDDPDGDGPEDFGFVDTGVVWTEGVYTELRVEADPIADALRYYYGGSLIYTGVVGVFAGTTVEQFAIVTDNFQAGDVGDFDNLSIDAGPTACPADWNDDTLVNSADISAFLTTWLDSVTQGHLLADFNADGQVNSGDISAFLAAWLQAVQGGC